jgi:hypothetical protein
MSHLQLYIVRDSRNRIVKEDIPSMYFHTKRAAKVARDRLIECTRKAHHVSPGPDHHKWGKT